MLVPSWLGPEWFAMTTVAVRFATEQLVAALGRLCIEIYPRTRFYRRQSKLIELQRRQLARDLIMVRIDGYMSKLRARRNWELSCVIETFVKERAHAVHFVDRDEGVPVWN